MPESLIDHYNMHIWRHVSQVEIGGPQYTSLLKCVAPPHLICYGSDSALATRYFAEHHDAEGLFLYDVEELLALDLDKVYGVVIFGVLSESWENEPAGSLVFGCYNGIYGVANTQPTVLIAFA
jgi:hypothetical protein